MNILFNKITSFVSSLMALLLCVVLLAGCKKDELSTPEMIFDIEEYTPPTEDALTVTSDLPAYVFPYDYKDFGAALINRLKNRVADLDEDNAEDLASVVFHSSQVDNIVDEIPLIIEQLLTGRNIIIVEPTIEEFNSFCDIITATYILLIALDEDQEILNEMDAVLGARQTFEAFYEMSLDRSKIESMFLMDTDTDGIFAEAIAVRGCDFHIVDRMKGIVDSELSYQQYDEQTGEFSPSEAPENSLHENVSPDDALTPYTYGLFADVFTNWINEQVYYTEEVEQMRQRGVDIFNTRSESTTKLSLEDVCSMQKVEYTISASTPLLDAILPVSVSFEICSVHIKERNSDFYCIYKEIISYNQLLNCGPEDPAKWRKKEGFGILSHLYPYYGPFMRNLKGQSICHPHSNRFLDSATQVVDVPSANSIQSVADVTVEKFSPHNSIGSVDQTSGFSYGFDGGLYLAADPGINLGFSVSYDSSTTQTFSDLEITASTSNGIPKWDYIGQNLPISHYKVFSANTHDIAPKTLRKQLEVDQSWIWCVPNPKGSYRMFDQTDVTTSLMYYMSVPFYTFHEYYNRTTSKRVSFMLMPPPRSEQHWMMSVKPYSDALDNMISTEHKRFWDKDNHELTLSDSTDESRNTIKEFINDFERDLNNKKQTWRDRNFTGEYTFTFYKVGGNDSYTINFNVEP